MTTMKYLTTCGTMTESGGSFDAPGGVKEEGKIDRVHVPRPMGLKRARCTYEGGITGPILQGFECSCFRHAPVDVVNLPFQPHFWWHKRWESEWKKLLYW